MQMFMQTEDTFLLDSKHGLFILLLVQKNEPRKGHPLKSCRNCCDSVGGSLENSLRSVSVSRSASSCSSATRLSKGRF